jgi:branched-chain amino acid transport system ATP-binding protein
MLLELQGVSAGYGQGDVVRAVSAAVDEGAMLAVLGPNGAGKSTLLKAIAGVVPATAGTVRLCGVELTGHPASEIARCGVYLVAEGRAVFPSLTVAENLRMATANRHAALGDTFDVFPALRDRTAQRAGTMSGGEQQMLALARAFVARPRLLLLDEPSLGLAPLVIDAVFQVIERFRATGTTVVLVEQYVTRALEMADTALVLNQGRATFSGAASALSTTTLADLYLDR